MYSIEQMNRGILVIFIILAVVYAALDNCGGGAFLFFETVLKILLTATVFTAFLFVLNIASKTIFKGDLDERKEMMRCNHIEWRDRMEEKFPDIIGDEFREDTERMKGDLKK